MNTIDAEMLRKLFLDGANNLSNNKEYINELNVFPVPDGDTGTNMTMTIMSAAKEVAALGDNVEMDVELIMPVAMEEQLRFAIREGGRTVGSGVVTKIVE